MAPKRPGSQQNSDDTCPVAKASEIGLSSVIVTRNESENVVALVKDVVDVVDEVVIVDSSDDTHFQSLREGVSNTPRVRLVRAVALGYVEPLRQFSFSLAGNDWILYLDSDERLSPQLKADLTRIIANNFDCAAILVNRITSVDGVRTSHSGSQVRTPRASAVGYGETAAPSYKWAPRDFQVRIFNRRKVIDNGTVHEAPKVSGKVTMLGPKYYLYETFSPNTETSKNRRYIKLELATRRFTFDYVVEKYPNELLNIVLRAYVAVTLRGMKDELSSLDYLFSFAAERLIRERDPRALLLDDPYIRLKLRAIDALSPNVRSYLFDLSREVTEKGGVTKYLDLANPSVVGELTRTYEKSTQEPVNVFLGLLMAEFQKRHSDSGGLPPVQEVMVEIERALDHAFGASSEKQPLLQPDSDTS